MPSKRIGKNVLANYMGMIIHIAIGFLLSPYLVRALGDTNYGIWSIAAALTGYMSLFDMGLSSAVNKYVSSYQGAKDQKSTNEVLSTAIMLFGFASCIVLLLSPIVSYGVVSVFSFDNTEPLLIQSLVLVVCFDVALFVFAGLFKGAIGGIQRYDTLNLIQISAAVYKALALYLVLESGFGVVEMAWAAASTNLLFIVTAFFVLRRQINGLVLSRKLISREMSRKLIGFSKFTFLAMVANQIVYYSDAFVIGYFMTAAAVTYYSIAWTLTEYSKRLCIAFSRTFTPAISELDALGKSGDIQRVYLQGSKYLILISNLFCLGFISLGGEFIAIWMGEKYQALCEDVLIILFINQLILSPQHISYALLQGIAQQKAYTYYTVLVSISSLVLSIALIEPYGLIGVAIGTVAPQILFHGLFVPILTLNAINLEKRRYLFASVLPTLIPGLALFGTLELMQTIIEVDGYLNLLGSAALATVIYGLVVYIICFDDSEKESTRALIRKIRV